MSEENEALVRRQEEELFSRGNLEAADEIYASDYVGHDPSNPEDVRGLEAAKQAAADYLEAFPDHARHPGGPYSRRGQGGGPLEVPRYPPRAAKWHRPHGQAGGLYWDRHKLHRGRQDRRRLGRLRLSRHDAAAESDCRAGVPASYFLGVWSVGRGG